MAVSLVGNRNSTWSLLWKVLAFSTCVAFAKASCSENGESMTAGPFFDTFDRVNGESAAGIPRSAKKSVSNTNAEISDAYSMEFTWHRSDGTLEKLVFVGKGQWKSSSIPGIEVLASELDNGLRVFDVVADGSLKGTSYLSVATYLSLAKPVVYSRYAEYDFIEEKTNLDSLSASVQWLTEGETQTPFTPVLGLENQKCGIELILPSNHHLDSSKDSGEITLNQGDNGQSFSWRANLSNLELSNSSERRLQFAVFNYCDKAAAKTRSNVVIYPAAAFTQVGEWLPALQPNVDALAFFTWKNFPIMQVGSPVVDESSTDYEEFSARISNLRKLGVKPLLYGALHGISSLDPLLVENKTNWQSDDARRSGWAQFKETRLQPITLESSLLQDHLLDNIETAWKQGFTESVYLDLALPTRTKYTSERAFGKGFKRAGMNFVPLLHQWAFLRELSNRKSALGVQGRIILHSGMIVPRFLSQYVDNVLVGEPLWREFAKNSSGEYSPEYHVVPEPLVRFFWGKRGFGEPILLPLLTTRYQDKLRRSKKSLGVKKRGDRALLKSETRDLVRFLLASDIQLWASGTDMKVVKDYLEGVHWLGGTSDTQYCVIPLSGSREGDALGIRSRGDRAIAYHLYKPSHTEGRVICQGDNSRWAAVAKKLSKRVKPALGIIRIE